MYIDMVQSTLLDLAARAVANTEFRVGQTLQGVVESTPSGLQLAAGRARLALPDGAGLKPGDTVSVEVQQGPQGVRLQVTPTAAQATTTPTAAAPSSSLTGMAAVLLEHLSGLSAQDATLQAAASRLVPATLAASETPSTATALRAMLSLFATREASGADLNQIVSMLATAEQNGVTLPPEAATLREFLAASPQDFQRLLQRMADASARPAEGRLAQLLPASHGNTLTPETVRAAVQNDLGTALAAVRDHAALAESLRGRGQLDAFQAAVSRVQDRLLGANVQNLRGLEQPYVFMELPFTPGGGIREGQLHVLADGQGSRPGQIDSRNASVVLDLSTTRLGELWVHLRTVGGQCQCQFRATSPDAAKAITDAAPELADALAQAGYTGARVQVGAWDGDRLQAAADLMQRFSSLSVTA